MALDKITHNDGLYGFNIYRNNQLVLKWDKTWFRAHLMTSRIIGEVNLDFLDATFYKQGLQQDESWTIINAHMREYLKDIVKASNTVSKQGNINKPAELKKIIDSLRNDYGEDPIVNNNQEPEQSKSSKSPDNEKKKCPKYNKKYS